MTEPGFTLLIGPQTTLGRALNDIIRESRGSLEGAGLLAYPSRIGDKAVREVEGKADASIVRTNLGIGGEKPVLLAALKALGPPAGAFRNRELLPDAEAFLAGFSPLLAGQNARVVLCIEPLHHFLHAMGHATANAAFSGTPWDALYEISWADLVTEVAEALPNADLHVLTTSGTVARPDDALTTVFGAFATAIEPATLKSHEAPEPPGVDWCSEYLGLDAVTMSLLLDRFEEDRAAIAAMPSVSLL